MQGSLLSAFLSMFHPFALQDLGNFLPFQVWGARYRKNPSGSGTDTSYILLLQSNCTSDKTVEVHRLLSKLPLLIQPNKVGLLSQQYFPGPMPKQNALTELFNTAKKY